MISLFLTKNTLSSYNILMFRVWFQEGDHTFFSVAVSITLRNPIAAPF
jgi:hypothetical protein